MIFAMKKIAFTMVLAACAETLPPVPAAAQDTCNAGNYAELIGQDATALELVLILGKVRVIRPGDAVTMDFLTDRINFQIDANERISAITCG